MRTKVDIGVHVHEKMRQKARTFKMSFDNEGARLSSNSSEQIFTEKLKSLLRFGARSERPKDLYDLSFLTRKVNRNRLAEYINLLVYEDEGMRENTLADIVNRLERTFSSRAYLTKLARVDANWLQQSPKNATKTVLEFVRSIR